MSGSFLTGKVALVTGGSGTIGLAIAKALLSSGANVILTARRMDKLETAKEQLLSSVSKEQGGGQVHIFSSDVSSEESVVELFQKIDSMKEMGGSVDLLVNNAGKVVFFV